MDTLHILILSLVQGITEFLPISSSAHLILTPYFFNWPDQGVVFDVALHIGTLLAVMLYFWRDVGTLLCGMKQTCLGRVHSASSRLFLHVCVSTLPLVVVAPVVKDAVATQGRSLVVIGLASCVFGVVLWWADKRAAACTSSAPSVRELTYKHALVFGLFQALALIPGTSRSGICMTAGRFMGFSRVEASRYAMLMAIPVILMIGAFSLISHVGEGVNWQEDTRALLLGVGLSCVSALGAIHVLMTWVERIGFFPFVVYRVALGLALLTLAWGF